MQIWVSVGGSSHIATLQQEAWRIVEEQTGSVTRKLVDTSEEHHVLENLIEESKPKVKYYGDQNEFLSLHYLLSTPFRYPPLKHGSRFGTRYERSLFYASLELETAMSERAYYKLAFVRASEGNLGGKSVNYTAFKVAVDTKKGINLCKEPFVKFKGHISSPASYADSQLLGSAMRQEGIEAFVSFSARKDQGKNLNIFTPKAFKKDQSIEKSYQTWGCYFTKESVEFYPKLKFKGKPIVYSVEDFFVEGKFPPIPG